MQCNRLPEKKHETVISKFHPFMGMEWKNNNRLVQYAKKQLCSFMRLEPGTPVSFI